MKRIFLLLLCLGLVAIGCKGKTGPAGASGSSGPGGTNGTTPSEFYTARFQTGVDPSTSYSGTTMNRIDSTNTTTSYPNDGSLIFASTSAGEQSAILLKFNIAGLIPSNATLQTAAVELVSTSSTSLSGPLTIGVHAISSYTWTFQATWSRFDGSMLWDYGFGSTCYGATLDTAVLPASYTGGTNRIGLTLPIATITAWMNGTNNGLAIISEHAGADAATGTVVFSTPADSTASYRPVLEVNYTL